MKNKENIQRLISSSIIIALSTSVNNLVNYKNAVAQQPILTAQSTISCIQPIADWLFKKTSNGSTESVKQAEDICEKTEGKIAISCLTETQQYYFRKTRLSSTESAAKAIEICQREVLENSDIAQTTDFNYNKVGATFYEGQNLSGNYFQSGKYQVFRKLGNSWNNNISSIRIARYCTVIVYEDSEYQGKLAVYEGQESGLKVNNLGVYWNNKISSMKIFCMGIEQ